MHTLFCLLLLLDDEGYNFPLQWLETSVCHVKLNGYGTDCLEAYICLFYVRHAKRSQVNCDDVLLLSRKSSALVGYKSCSVLKTGINHEIENVEQKIFC